MISGTPGPIPLEIQNLELWFPSGQNPALVDVNLRLMPGTVTAIIGPAGVGKSTLFKAILSELAISNGTIKVAGEEVKNGEAVNPNHFSYVPQKTNLMPRLTVWETIELAVYARLPEAKTEEARHKVVNDVLQKLSMTHKKDGLVKDLSGGEERRVSIALELVSNPHLLLLDEPTSGLDEGLDKELHLTLRNLADDPRKPAVLFVTHSTTHLNLVDPATGRTYVDQVIAIGKATDKSNTATVRHIGKPNQILTDFGVNTYSDVMKTLRMAPRQLPKISTEKPDAAFKRSYKTLSWSRSFIYNLQRQWLLIGKAKGLLKSIRNTVMLGVIVAAVLWMVSRLGLGVNLDGPNQEFLTYTSMLVLLLAFGGTLLPIMGIVNSWDVIRREQRWGVSARSFIWAQTTLQMLLIIPAVAAATVLSLWLTSGPTDQTLLPQTERFSAYWQLFLLLLLSTLASYAIGVFIGSSHTSSNKANYASGLVFAIMLVGNGLIFTWHEFWAIYYPSFLIPSRTGIAMIASNFNAEMVMGGTTDDAFRMSLNGLYLAMGVMVAVGIAFLIVAMIAVRSPLRQTGSGAIEAPSGGRGTARQRNLLPAAVFASAILISSATIYANRTAEGEVFGTPDITRTNESVAQASSQNSQPSNTNSQQQQGQQQTSSSSGSSTRQKPVAVEVDWGNPTPTPIQPQSPVLGAVQIDPTNPPADTFAAAAVSNDVPGTPESSASLSQPAVFGAMDSSPNAADALAPDDHHVDTASDADDTVESDPVAESEETVTETEESFGLTSSMEDTTAAGAMKTYFDIGGDTEPELRHFHDVIDTEAIAVSCDLGDYPDWTKRPQRAQEDGSFAIVTVDVIRNQEATISFCIEEDVDSTNDWSVWLGLSPPTEHGCNSLHLSKPADLTEGLNVVAWTIPAECVHLDQLMLVFSGTTSDGAALWGVLVEQESTNASGSLVDEPDDSD